MAKQYISDNINTPLTVLEVADYCHLSTKQLTRIFIIEEGMHTAEYIRKMRCIEIEKLLCDKALSLKAISEQMGFSSEYYFNSYFKKYAGLAPGIYRRSMK
jgi:AraC-like DNA-binding protein